MRLEKIVSIGRKGSDVCLENKSISRVHATVRGDDQETPLLRAIVADKHSKLGTFVQKSRSEEVTRVYGEAVVNVGEYIIFGSKAITYM